MTDAEFTELVDLYLDQEISEEQSRLLTSEIESREDRYALFAERCKLHEAMRIVLEPSSKGRVEAYIKSRRGGIGYAPMNGLSPTSVFPRIGRFLRWGFFSGIAAMILLAVFLFQHVVRDTAAPLAVGESEFAESELNRSDRPFSEVSRNEFKRYAALQQGNSSVQHASLISQMRLMGLRPEHTPVDKQLQEIDLAAVYTPEATVNQAELFQRLQNLKALPETKILQMDGDSFEKVRGWSSLYTEESSTEVQPSGGPERLQF